MDSEPRLALFEHGNAVRQPADFAQFALDFPHVVTKFADHRSFKCS